MKIILMRELLAFLLTPPLKHKLRLEINHTVLIMVINI